MERKTTVTVNLERLQASQRLTIIGAVLNLFLGFAKLFAGWFGHSHGLVADGFHSLADLATDLLVYIATYFGVQDADEEHPYGHGRIETVATGFIAALLLITGGGIIYDAVEGFRVGQFQSPESFVVGVAVISILVKELLFRYSKRIADALTSELRLANAWHHRSASLSSVVVVVGVRATMAGYAYFDALAAIIVGIMIIKMAWGLGYNSLRELIDTAVAPDVLADIESAITSVDGVESVHELRTRSMRGEILIDVHVIVAATISVSEGHHICEQVYLALSHLPHAIHDIMVHIDAEDDEVAKPSSHLPARKALEAALREHCQGVTAAQHIQRLTLHYLDGEVYVDIELPLTFAADDANLQNQFHTAIASSPVIKHFKLLYTA